MPFDAETLDKSLASVMAIPRTVYRRQETDDPLSIIFPTGLLAVFANLRIKPFELKRQKHTLRLQCSLFIHFRLIVCNRFHCFREMQTGQNQDGFA